MFEDPQRCKEFLILIIEEDVGKKPLRLSGDKYGGVVTSLQDREQAWKDKILH